MNGHRRRNGVRKPRANLSAESLLLVLGGGQRLEILRLLVAAPMSVGAIAAAVFLNMNSVSRDLALLEERGLVIWKRVKNMRIYRPTDWVSAFRQADMLQIAIATDMGHWLVVHLDESADPAQATAPPTHFVQ